MKKFIRGVGWPALSLVSNHFPKNFIVFMTTISKPRFFRNNSGHEFFQTKWVRGSRNFL